MAYRTGLRKPTGLLPAFSLASLIKVMMDANTGVDAEVPTAQFQLGCAYEVAPGGDLGELNRNDDSRFKARNRALTNCV